MSVECSTILAPALWPLWPVYCLTRLGSNFLIWTMVVFALAVHAALRFAAPAFFCRRAIQEVIQKVLAAWLPAFSACSACRVHVYLCLLLVVKSRCKGFGVAEHLVEPRRSCDTSIALGPRGMVYFSVALRFISYFLSR